MKKTLITILIFFVLILDGTIVNSQNASDFENDTTEAQYQEVSIASFAKNIYGKIISGIKFTFSSVKEATTDIIKINSVPTPEPGVISAVKKANSEQSNTDQSNETDTSTTSPGTSTTTFRRSSSGTSGSNSGNSTTPITETIKATATPKPVTTSTIKPTPTNTVPNPTPTSTVTPAPTATMTPFPTNTATITPSPTNSVSPLPDTTAPTISIISPTNNAVVNNNVTLTANTQDPVIQGRITSGILGVQFKLDNINLGPEVTTIPYSGTWNTIGVINGNHTLTAVARDVAGNITTSNPIYVFVSNTTVSPSVTPTPKSSTSNSVTPTPTPSNSPQANSRVQIASIYETLKWIFEQISETDNKNY